MEGAYWISLHSIGVAVPADWIGKKATAKKSFQHASNPPYAAEKCGAVATERNN